MPLAWYIYIILQQFTDEDTFFFADQSTIYGELVAYEAESSDSVTIQATDGFEVKNVSKVRASSFNSNDEHVFNCVIKN